MQQCWLTTSRTGQKAKLFKEPGIGSTSCVGRTLYLPNCKQRDSQCQCFRCLQASKNFKRQNETPLDCHLNGRDHHCFFTFSLNFMSRPLFYGTIVSIPDSVDAERTEVKMFHLFALCWEDWGWSNVTATGRRWCVCVGVLWLIRAEFYAAVANDSDRVGSLGLVRYTLTLPAMPRI